MIHLNKWWFFITLIAFSVAVSKADKTCCGTNQQLVDCFRSCPPNTCSAIGEIYECPLETATNCKPGCDCVKNYTRDANNNCIPVQNCPNTCGGDPNASNRTYSPTCIKTCDNHKVPNLVCDNATTTVGCVCNQGFVLNTLTGKCVTTNQCPEGCGGDANAEFLGCGNVCPRTCARPVVTICPDICELSGGCGCKTGYVQGTNGRCILPAQCSQGCGGDINAVNGTYHPGCVATCDNYKTNITCRALVIEEGCVCKEGFVYDTILKKCVQPNQCEPGCGGDVNAQYYDCGWCTQSCDDIGNPRACTADCQPGGCGCKGGYVLYARGKCIRPKQCPAKQCGCDEKWDCPKICSRVRCHEIGVSLEKCPVQTQEEIDSCIPQCICIRDYLRDDKGRCIPPNRCPPAPLPAAEPATLNT